MRRGRSSFTRMRKGAPQNKKPKWFLPTSPGDYGIAAGGTRALQPHMHLDLAGTILSGNADDGYQRGWLFAMTPEVMERGGAGAAFPGLLGDQDSEYDRLRIAGMDGKLFFTPYGPVNEVGPEEPFAATNMVGFVHWAWFKVTAGQSDIDPGGFTRAYPWLTFGLADAAAGADTFGPAFSEDPLTFATNRDWRYRAKLMAKGTKPWSIDLRNTWMDTPGSTQHQYIPHPIEIPLSRKLVCDVGKGEALGMAYMIHTTSGVNGQTGAPSARFDFQSLRVKCYELD